MSRIVAFFAHWLMAVCILVAFPALLLGYLAMIAFRGARILFRKLKHRLLGCKRVRRRVRSNLYPEAAL